MNNFTMRNFDYIKELGMTDLHRLCSAAEEHQWSNPDFSVINSRKALDYSMDKYLGKTVYRL